MNTADLTQKLNSNFNATIKLFYATGYNYLLCLNWVVLR